MANGPGRVSAPLWNFTYQASIVCNTQYYFPGCHNSSLNSEHSNDFVSLNLQNLYTVMQKTILWLITETAPLSGTNLCHINLGRKWLFFWPPGYNPSLRAAKTELRAGIWKQRPKYRPKRNAMLHTDFLSITFLGSYYKAQAYLPKDGNAHNVDGPPLLFNN